MSSKAELYLSSAFSEIPNDWKKPAQDSGTNIQTDATIALCARIQAAAIKCEAYHVFVDYAAHTAKLHVVVYRSDMDYQARTDTWPNPLINEDINLKRCDAHKALMVVMDKLQRLGVEV